MITSGPYYLLPLNFTCYFLSFAKYVRCGYQTYSYLGFMHVIFGGLPLIEMAASYRRLNCMLSLHDNGCFPRNIHIKLNTLGPYYSWYSSRVLLVLNKCSRVKHVK